MPAALCCVALGLEQSHAALVWHFESGAFAHGSFTLFVWKLLSSDIYSLIVAHSTQILLWSIDLCFILYQQSVPHSFINPFKLAKVITIIFWYKLDIYKLLKCHDTSWENHDPTLILGAFIWKKYLTTKLTMWAHSPILFFHQQDWKSSQIWLRGVLCRAGECSSSILSHSILGMTLLHICCVELIGISGAVSPLSSEQVDRCVYFYLQHQIEIQKSRSCRNHSRSLYV